MRLDRFLSNNTFYSRKEINKFIKNRNVKVNDVIVIEPSFHIKESDVVIFFGKIIKQNWSYIALYKPLEYVCSHNNNDGESVLNLIPLKIKNLHIVGRLDKNTTGLIILTNDGEFTHKIKNPKSKIEKEYEVVLEKAFTKEMESKLKTDIFLDGKKLKPFTIYKINNNKLNIILLEGKYHQIKRLFQMVNNPVKELKRIRIGKLKLENLNLSEGEYIFIDKDNI